MTEVDEFLAAPEPKRRDFDRWGRYLLPHPQTGKVQAWTRATTFAKALSDEFALSQWSQRMVVKGLTLRPDLVSLASTLDVKADRDQMNKLVEQAKDAAGQKTKANEGTARHSFTEIVDRGGSIEDVHPSGRADVAAYVDALAQWELIPIPHLIERKTAVQDLGVAGTLDRIYRDADGEYVIGDLKTGNIEYEAFKIQIQLALYTHGVNQSGVWDPDRERWDTRGIPPVRTDYGIVMHLPVGSAQCTVYKVNLTEGWEDAHLCAKVRARRNRRVALKKYEPSWEERFAAVRTREQASSLWRVAHAALGEGPELNRLVGIGQRALDRSTSV